VEARDSVACNPQTLVGREGTWNTVGIGSFGERLQCLPWPRGGLLQLLPVSLGDPGQVPVVTPVILATWKAEIRRITVRGQPGQKSS
jgi:hypothetical protein